jgi:hypothetical protein
MSLSRKFSSLRNGFVLRGLILGVSAAGLVAALTDIAGAAIVVRRVGLPLPMMVSGSYVAARPVVWVAPPAPRVFVAPAPRPGWIWSPGYWRWTGATYIWTDGVWLAARPGFIYAPARWERFPGGWHFAPGGWVRRPL